MIDTTTALTAVTNNHLPIEQQATAYVAIRQLRRELDRILRSPRVRDLEHRLAIHMDEEGLRELGGVKMTLKSIDPRWPVNDPGNWVDSGVQDDLAALIEEQQYEPFIRHVPDHYEVIPKVLADAMRSGDPAALRFWSMCMDRKYRTREGKEPVLTVTEPPSETKAAA